LAGLVSAGLYIVSFSPNLNVVGDFSTRPKEWGCNNDSKSRRCLSFMYEVISVSVSDMASLFDEANWRVSPLLGRQGSTYSSESQFVI